MVEPCSVGACHDGSCSPLTPVVVSLTASPLWGDAPLSTVLSWSITGDVVRCTLDLDGDGATDELLEPCPAEGQRPVTLEEPGEYIPLLVVTARDGAVVSQTLRLFANRWVLSDSAIDLDDVPGLNGFERGDDGLVMLDFVTSEHVLSLQAGDILWSREGEGLLVRVVEAYPPGMEPPSGFIPSGEPVWLFAEDAALDDLFSEAFIGIVGAVPSSPRDRPGAGKADLISVDETLSGSASIDFPPFDIVASGSASQVGLKDVSISAEAEYGLGLFVLKKTLFADTEFDVSIWGKLSWNVAADVSPGIGTWKKPLNEWPLGGFYAGPLLITFQGVLLAFGEAKVSANIGASLSGSAGFEAGVTNEGQDGVHAYGELDADSGLDFTPGADGNIVSVDFKAGLGFQFRANIYNTTGGVYAELDGYARASLDVGEELCGDVAVGYQGKVGADAKLFKVISLKAEHAFPAKEWPLAGEQCYPGFGTSVGSCVPDCFGKLCGDDDGCGEPCDGPCPGSGQCTLGKCTCVPSCAGKPCGEDDACGSPCDGPCPGNNVCDLGKCHPPECTPQCAGKACGGDGCGGTCPPGCSTGETCNKTSGQCEAKPCVPQCAGKACGDDGCGGTCAPGCGADESCNEGTGQCEDGPCVPMCAGVDGCGPDGCGGSCGLCNPSSAVCSPEGVCIPVEDSPPSGQILAPAEGATVSGAFSVTVSVVDNNKVVKVSVLLSGPAGVSAKASSTPGTAETTWTTDPFDVAGWSDGTVYVSLWAEDEDNPAVKLQTIEVLLDAEDDCTPDCAGKECGPDGCGETCEPGCGAQETCGKDGLCAEASTGCTDGWCLIPAGSFQMGSPDTEPCSESNEHPQHPVTITRSFYLKQTEVTQKEWSDLVGNNPSYFSACGPSCPVEQVNWYEAVAYCNLLSASAGLPPCYTLANCSGKIGEGMTCSEPVKPALDCTGYRLPTEAEWEYATRAGTTTAYWSGTNIGTAGQEVCGSGEPYGTSLPSVGWYFFNSECKTHPVGQLEPNAWGLYDVHGNVWEWCWDWYDSSYYSLFKEFDPTGPAGSDRVIRGGSWFGDAGNVRSAYRSYGGPSYGYYDAGDVLGFRPARSLP